MEFDALRQEIDTLIAVLGEDTVIAKPKTEREVIAKIRAILDRTRDQRTASARNVWESYLPYAAKRCDQMTRVEEGWEDDLDYFTSENAQFWLDDTVSYLEKGDITAVKNALGQVLEALRMLKRDRITQVDLLLQALDCAIEINEKKRAVQLYEEAEKVYHKHLTGGAAYTGSAWLPKIKKLGRRLTHYREKLRRYFHYAETITVSVAADTQADLERVIEYLQQSLTGKVTVTRRVKEEDEQGKSRADRFRARIRISLE